MHKDRYTNKDESKLEAVNPVAVVAVLVGAIVGLTLPGVAALNSIGTACVIYFVGDKMKKAN